MREWYRSVTIASLISLWILTSYSLVAATSPSATLTTTINTDWSSSTTALIDGLTSGINNNRSNVVVGVGDGGRPPNWNWRFGVNPPRTGRDFGAIYPKPRGPICTNGGRPGARAWPVLAPDARGDQVFAFGGYAYDANLASPPDVINEYETLH
jgi:hypothetical protein